MQTSVYFPSKGVSGFQSPVLRVLLCRANRGLGMKLPLTSSSCHASSQTFQPLQRHQLSFIHGLGPRKLGWRRKSYVARSRTCPVKANALALDVPSLLQIRGVRDGCAFVFATTAAMILVKSINYLASKQILDTVGH
jgi:hypothetical protein